MRLIVPYLPLLLLISVYGGLVSAQDAYGAYTYPNSQQGRWYAPTQSPMQSPEDARLRWRPLEAESRGSDESFAKSPATPGPGVSDYTDEPFGLPPGTYRRIEERHTITPHLEGYRFRPIDAEEQVRNRSRNEDQDRFNRDLNRQPAADSATVEYYRPPEQTQSLKFRPDPRLDKSTRKAPPRYAFPLGAEAPQFRPQ